MSIIKSLENLTSNDAAHFGSKCINLARLYQAGYRVPPALGVSSQLYLDSIGPILSRFNLADWPNLDDESRTREAASLRQMILSEVTISREVITEIREAILGTLKLSVDKRLAVRSSATHEDSGTASFAGQMESYLNVTIDEIESNIILCWASLWLARAVNYRHHRKLPHTSVAIAVIIQEQLTPDSAGVMFTRDPLSPDVNRLIIEAVQGLGVALVQGEVVPDKFVLNVSDPLAPTILSRQDGSQHSADGILQTLSDEQSISLATTGTQIAQMMGSPQDIEWALCNGAFHILQARPITTLGLGQTNPKNIQIESITPIRVGDGIQIPVEVSTNDKVKLRLISDEHGLLISPGWLVRVSTKDIVRHEDILADIGKCDQVSMVLLSPRRLNGQIFRQFSTGVELKRNVSDFISVIGQAYDVFTFIITEIYRPTLSGISKLVQNDMLTEAAFGSYIPKGVADPSLYIVGSDYQIKQSRIVQQMEAVFIVDGKPSKVQMDRRPELSHEQLRHLYDATLAIQETYPNATLEYGVDHEGHVYLIDVIKEDEKHAIHPNIQVMSPGKVVGKAIRVVGEAMLWDSLDAHFHSQRSEESGQVREPLIVIADMPYLSLESFLPKSVGQPVGFVFEKGSILGHLAILLREYTVPAVISPEMFANIRDGDTVGIDTERSENYVWVQ